LKDRELKMKGRGWRQKKENRDQIGDVPKTQQAQSSLVLFELTPRAFVSREMSSSTTVTSPPPEVESTIARLSSNRSVKGVLILNSSGILIRSAGLIFDNNLELVKKYIKVSKALVEKTKELVTEIDEVVRCSTGRLMFTFRRFAGFAQVSEDTD
jgi:hypothetical protein